MRMTKLIISFSIVLHLSSTLFSQSIPNMNAFVASLDTLRQRLKVPGMAVAVMRNDTIVLATGLGYADLQNRIKATKETTFRIASITKTFTSTLIMQLVEQGKLSLDDPISKYGVDLGNSKITVKDLLAHTSEGEPGAYFQYNGFRYGRLGPVIEKVTGIPFYELILEKIIEPIGMKESAPGISKHEADSFMQRREDVRPYFENAFSHLAKAYALNSNGKVVDTNYLDEFGAFGGLMSSVIDILKYSSAIDRHQFLSAKTQQQIFTPNRTSKGAITPYGLGWFVQNYKGVDFYWHYGQTPGESGLFIKVPSKKLTFVALANCDMLSTSAPFLSFPLGDGDFLTSPVGQLFYKYFMNDNGAVKMINYAGPANELKSIFADHAHDSYQDFYNREMITQAAIDRFDGDTLKSRELLQLYRQLNLKKNLSEANGTIIASLTNVDANQDLSKKFSIPSSTHLRVFGVGEDCSTDYSSWCDFGWIEDSSGKVVWQMQGQTATYAGGAIKNQKVDTVITLPAGNYTLRFKSDWAHAYDNWDSAPPDSFSWGIVLFKMTE